ncbi:MAG: hypothetical protein IJR57_03175 [Ruminococcus sp.]|nr:hypothetical protein [Ruminococcus sp.]
MMIMIAVVLILAATAVTYFVFSTRAIPLSRAIRSPSAPPAICPTSPSFEFSPKNTF